LLVRASDKNLPTKKDTFTWFYHVSYWILNKVRLFFLWIKGSKDIF
jgi:hypothetical protein